MDSIEPHHIVALGASSGGLEELIVFFENTSLDGTAFVIVQHLSPDCKSRLDQILSRHSKLTMQVAEDGMPLQRNFVYLIPGDKFLTMQRGRLHLTEKAGVRMPHMTVNTFFTSLAAECGPRAIGVILSGLGSDGTDGLKAIKRAGGMVLVRNPETAQFNSMPSNAIATGLVDFIVEPESMPAVIDDYVKRELTLLANSISDNQNMEELVGLISAQLPFDFSDYKPTTILRRIKKRAAYNNFEQLESYLDFARSNPAEIEALAKDFLISVTAFFRDQKAFDVLKNEVLPNIVNGLQTTDEIRIWIAGCATGEEAYSMAIMVRELLGDRHSEYQVKIFATDIDSAALLHAGKGIYPATAVAKIEQSQLEKYFVRTGDSYQVKPVIRKMVLFAQHDLVKNPPYCNMHLISCRNLLIYMTPVLQKKIYQMLLFGLKQNGFLFLGSSESPIPILNSLEVTSKQWKIFKNLKAARLLNFETFSLPESLYRQPYNQPAIPDELPRGSDKTLAAAINETIIDDLQDLVICIDENKRVLKSYGDTSKFLKQKIFTTDLMDLLPAPLTIAFSTLLNKVGHTQQKASVTGVVIQQNDQPIRVDLSVIPVVFKGRKNGLLVVRFSESHNKPSDAEAFEGLLHLDAYTQSLEEENREFKEQLAGANDRLSAMHENMQSFNEELLSANEEMQSANEEMQSINEELHTINAEYQAKNRELSELNDDLNNYFRSNTNGQLFVSEGLQLKRFSPGTVRLINLLESDIGRPITDISTNFRFESITDDVKQVIADGQTITRQVQANDGRWYQIMTMAYVQQASTSRTGAVITFNDITELKTTQHELNHKNEVLTRINEDLDNFVHTASHDLLAPLASLSNAIGLIKEIVPSNDELDPLFRIVKDSVKNFKGMIEEIGGVARIENQSVSTELVALQDIFESVEWSLSDLIKQSDALIKTDFQITHIHFSKKNLRSILFNLVSNGIKYSGERRPEIKVQTLTDDGFVILTVADNGIGLNQDDIDKIFRKYERIQTGPDGQGIGLFLTKKIVDSAGGRIEVESTPDVGSTFKIFFPIN